MDMVSADLELVEKEYFSLTYRDVNNMKVSRLRQVLDFEGGVSMDFDVRSSY